MSEIRCTLHSTFAARYSERNPVWAMQNLDLARSSVFSVVYIQYYAFKPTYLRFCCSYADNSIRVIIHICCRIQGALSGLRCVNSGPCTSSVIAVLHIRSQIFESTFLLFYSTHAENSMHLILHSCCQIQPTSGALSYVISGLRQIQRSFSFAYSGWNILINVSPLLLQICRQRKACYTPKLLPNTAHISRFGLCRFWTLWSAA